MNNAIKEMKTKTLRNAFILCLSLSLICDDWTKNILKL